MDFRTTLTTVLTVLRTQVAPTSTIVVSSLPYVYRDCAFELPCSHRSVYAVGSSCELGRVDTRQRGEVAFRCSDYSHNLSIHLKAPLRHNQPWDIEQDHTSVVTARTRWQTPVALRLRLSQQID
eukprot:jgi/Ulvmu1/581/UM001_0589.1